jgi:hypothetical protein
VEGYGAGISPWTNAPERASMRINALAAGEGQGCGVAVYGPQEGAWNDPDRRTAQTGVLAGTIDPPFAAAPYVVSFAQTSFAGVDDPAS